MNSTDMRIVCRYRGETLYIGPDGLLYEHEAGHYNWAQCDTAAEWKREIDAYHEAIFPGVPVDGLLTSFFTKKDQP